MNYFTTLSQRSFLSLRPEKKLANDIERYNLSFAAVSDEEKMFYNVDT
jgi:hypothetical protein